MNWNSSVGGGTRAGVLIALLFFGLFYLSTANAQGACGGTLEIDPSFSQTGPFICSSTFVLPGTDTAFATMSYGPTGDSGYNCFFFQTSQPTASQISGTCPTFSKFTLSESGGNVGGWNIASAPYAWICVYDQTSGGSNCFYVVIPANGGSSSSGSSISANGIVGVVCGVYYAVSTMIFLLGLTLMILGGAVYAGSHFVPGSSRGTLQGYAMGMLMGGIIGVLIAVIAPYMLSVITGNTALTSVCI